MSEDEQIWSFNDTRSNLQRGRLIVCAMAEVKPGERWPMDNHDFALAVDRQTAKGNVVAKGILVFTASTGRYCPDFNEMLSFALSRCLVEYLSPSYEEMVLNMGGRTLKYLLKNVQAEELEAAKALVQEFWNINRGNSVEVSP